jgi:hypothetical protein
MLYFARKEQKIPAKNVTDLIRLSMTLTQKSHTQNVSSPILAF